MAVRRATETIGKRAQTFSLISVLMSALFILLFSSLLAVQGTNQAQIAQAQAQLLDSFMGNTDAYIATLTAKAAYPILSYTVNHLADPGSNGYYLGYAQVMTSCLTDGSYIDTSMPPLTTRKICSDSAQNNSLTFHLDDLFTQASAVYDAQITYDILRLELEQTDAYEFTISSVILIEVNRNGAYQSRIANVSKELSIVGLPNPATIGTAYEQTVRHAPDRELTRSTNFFGNLSLIADYVNNAYYFRDTRGTSFLDKLEGVEVYNLSYDNPVGIMSFIPAQNGGTNLYVNNNTAHLDMLYTSEAYWDCSLLRRIDHPSIDDDILFPLSFLVNDLGITDTSDLLTVCGCCGPSGCTNACG